MTTILLALVAAAVTLWPIGEALAGPPTSREDREDEVERRRRTQALRWIDDEQQRARLERVETFVVPTQPIVPRSYARELGASCSRYLGWNYGAAKSAQELLALGGGFVGERVEELAGGGDHTADIVAFARELADVISGYERVCERIEGGALEAADIALLRAIYDGDPAARTWSDVTDIYVEAGPELRELLAAGDDANEDDAERFIEKALPEGTGRGASVVSPSSLASAGEAAFEGLAEFLIDRAKEEAIAYLRDQLVERVCAPSADPILFIPRTCEVLRSADASLSISAMGAALHHALEKDLELLPDRVFVLAGMQVPEAAYSGTLARMVLSLVHDVRGGKNPLEFVASVHFAPPVDCEQALTSSSIPTVSGDAECADTMAMLRFASMLAHAIASQTDSGSSTPLAYLTLGVAFSLDARVEALPAEVREHVLATVGWASFSVDAAHLEALAAVVASVEHQIGDLEERIADLSRDERPLILDEEAYMLAAMSARIIAGLSEALLDYYAAVGVEVDERWRVELDATLGRSEELFNLARSHAAHDWAAAGFETLRIVGEVVESNAREHGGAEAGGSEAFVRLTTSLRTLLPLLVEFANAKSSEELNLALQAAFPAGGYKRKFRQPTVAINGFLGVYGGGTLSWQFNASDQVEWKRLGGEFALFAPIGVQVTAPLGVARRRPSNVGALVSVIDLGGITTSKWLEDETLPENTIDATQTSVGEPAAFNIAGLFSPGAYLTFGLASSPFVVGVGASVNPFAQKLTTVGFDSNGDIETTQSRFLSTLRFGAFLAVDITFVSFGLRCGRSCGR